MYADRAETLFLENYNCAQAVFGAFTEAFGMEFSEAMRATSSLGGGLGHSGEVCGAILGMCMAIGMAKGYTDPTPEHKALHAERVKRAVETFKKEFQKTGCDELRVPDNRSVCACLVRYAAEIAADEIATS